MRKRSIPRVSGMEASQAPEYFLSAEDAKGMSAVRKEYLGRNEGMRLHYVRRLGLLEKQFPCEQFDALVQIISMVFKTSTAAILIIGSDRQHVLASRGLNSTVFDRNDSIFSFLGDADANMPVVVLDASKDQRLTGCRAVTSPQGVRFGVLCPVYFLSFCIGCIWLADEVPRESFSAEQTDTLLGFARAVTEIISSAAKIESSVSARYEQALQLWVQGVAPPLRDASARMESLMANKLGKNASFDFRLAEEMVEEIEQQVLNMDDCSIRALLLQRLSAMWTSVIDDSSSETSMARILADIQHLVTAFRREDCVTVAMDQMLQKISSFRINPSCLWAALANLFYFLDSSDVKMSISCFLLRCNLPDEQVRSQEFGQLCIEIQIRGEYIPSDDYQSLWSAAQLRSAVKQAHWSPHHREAARTSSGSLGEITADLKTYFEPIKDVIRRLGGGIQFSENAVGDVATASIWLPCTVNDVAADSISRIANDTLNRSFFYAKQNALLALSSEHSSSTLSQSRRLSDSERNVLVIDDSISVQKILHKYFRGIAVNCQVASDGQEGLALLKVNDFDVIFVDFFMPKLNGVSTIQIFNEWRAAQQFGMHFLATAIEQPAHGVRSIIIVGMSSDYDPELCENAYKAGMDVFVKKPVKQEKLLRIMAAVGTNYSRRDLRRELSDVPV